MFQANFFSLIHQENVYLDGFLNKFISLGKAKTSAVRLLVQDELLNSESLLKTEFSHFFQKQEDVVMHLPISVGDFTDFYSSKYHAENVGEIFRNSRELSPNWKHMPIAYNGRSSSIVVSGKDIHRPNGQFLEKDTDIPVYGKTRFLDFELELAAIIGRESKLGEVVNFYNAQEYIFGFTLFNDWSARDFQKWEYQPLGPFTSKSFASTMSAWVITTEALEPFKTKVKNHKHHLDYLRGRDIHSYDIKLTVRLNNQEIVSTNYNNLYWTPAQQIAHQTINGCNLRVGDVLASGTISGPELKGKGSMIEITKGGSSPLELNDGTTRNNLLDGDKVEITGLSKIGKVIVGFGINVGIITKMKHD